MAELNRMVPRVVDATSTSALFTMAHLIESVPVRLDAVEAIIVMPGLGEHARLQAAVSAWEAHPHIQYLIVAGTNDIEKTQPQPSLEFLESSLIGLHRTEGVITQVSAEHTKDQTDWIAHTLRDKKIQSAALFVSHWHLPRAYGTLLKSMDELHVKLALFPVAVGTSPTAVVPETGQTVIAMSAGEAKRISTYQELGHVTSLDELEYYLAWLWQQKIAPIHANY